MATYSIADLDARLTASDRLPVLFVGHGTPMHAIDDNAYTRAWVREGERLPDAQAIVVVSAHWQTPGSTRITDAPRNRVIHDFWGFPDELFAVQYPSEGDPRVARELQRRLHAYEARLDSEWGLDHGTWSVLRFLAPEPDVPVLQISIDMTMPLPRLYEQFSRLRALRRRGVLFLGSGNIVHALARLRSDGASWDWAQQFDADTADALRERRTAELLDPFATWSEARLAVPTDDHYRPMVAALSLLEDGEDVRFFNESIDLGAIGMRSFVSA